MKIPPYSLKLIGRTDESDEPRHGVQYAVLDGAGVHAYGDQDWVAGGGALRDYHPGARVVRRTVTIAYGEWEDADDLLGRARAYLAEADFGEPCGCISPTEDPRTVIADLVDEVTRLRGAK